MEVSVEGKGPESQGVPVCRGQAMRRSSERDGKQKPGREVENQEHVCPGSQVKNAFQDEGNNQL